MPRILSSFPPPTDGGALLVFRAAGVIFALALGAAAVELDTLSLPGAADTVSAVPPDTIGTIPADTGITAALMTKPKLIMDSAVASDSFDVNSGFFFGGGAGLSIGSMQVFTLWKDGLQQSLADFGLKDTSFRLAGGPGDTLGLVFTTVKTPDIYNMIFPISLCFGRLFPTFRYGAAISFSMLSKDTRSNIAVGTETDSTARSIDISQSMGMYSVSLEVLYGRAIPFRYFSIDGADRSDIIIGLSVTPFLGLSRATSVSAPADSASDPRLWALRDSVERHLHSVSASGIAIGWRLGIAKMRHLSKNGGIEGRLTYCGSWASFFSSGSGSLTERELSEKSAAPNRKVSYLSNRFEISFSLIRKL